MVIKTKKKKSERIPIWEEHNEPTEISKFRKQFLDDGYDLIDITPHIEFKRGCSGNCNDFNEPDDNIYHIQAYYRNDIVANFKGKSCYPIDDEKYVIFIAGNERDDDDDFIIFRKCPISKTDIKTPLHDSDANSK